MFRHEGTGASRGFAVGFGWWGIIAGSRVGARAGTDEVAHKSDVVTRCEEEGRLLVLPFMGSNWWIHCVGRHADDAREGGVV